MCDKRTESDFEDQFNLDVFESVLEEEEIRIINKMIQKLLRIYQEMLTFTTIDFSKVLVYNKYLKEIFMYHLEQQNPIHAIFALMLKYPETSNFNNESYSYLFEINQKKVSKTKIFELIKRDIEESEINQIICDKESRNKLTEYLVKEITERIDENMQIFKIGRLNNKKIEGLKNISLTDFELKLKELKKTLTTRSSAEEFWKKN
jgi:hypothetical protein